MTKPITERNGLVYGATQIPVETYVSHANIWWGGMLAGIGAGYCIHFAPGKKRG